MTQSIKDQLVRLGAQRPDLRGHIRPVLAELDKHAADTGYSAFVADFKEKLMAELEKAVKNWGLGEVVRKPYLTSKLPADSRDPSLEFRVQTSDRDVVIAVGLGSPGGSGSDPKLSCTVVGSEDRFGKGDIMKRVAGISMDKLTYAVDEVSFVIQDMVSKDFGIRVNVF